MRDFKEIKPQDMQLSPFYMIGDRWMLLSADDGRDINAMTCSWGGVGVLYKKNVAAVFVRPSRYTNELMKKGDNFSLSFFPKDMQATLKYFGSHSGRLEDKIANSKLTLIKREGFPCYEEASLTILCKKLCAVPLSSADFYDDSIKEQFYPEGDTHIMYVGEIKSILE